MKLLVALSIFAAPATAYAQTLPADPLDSPMWEFRAKELFAGAPIVFDERIKVLLPIIAEDQRVVPVTVDARGAGSVQRIVLFADLNPIPVAVDFAPKHAAAYFTTRIKLDQRTPVRAAVLMDDGVWHIAGGWIDAAGGGCSAPPVSRVKGDWSDHLGEMRGAAWNQGDETRLRVSFRHPMDTGLVENIAAYNIETIKVSDSNGQILADMTIFGSVSEDPAFTLLLDKTAPGPLMVAARDTNGLEFDGSVAKSSKLAFASTTK